VSDLEFDVLDELYFLIPFEDLLEKIGLSDNEIKPILVKLLRKDWIRVYQEPQEELETGQVDLEIHFRDYYYLASKDGLRAHTTEE